MKSGRVFAGVILLLWAVCWCGCWKASALWFGFEPSGAVSTKTTTIPLSDGGTQTTTETVIKPSETGALAGAAAGAALGAKIGTMIGGPAGTVIGAAVGGTIGGIAGWIFGPA